VATAKSTELLKVKKTKSHRGICAAFEKRCYSGETERDCNRGERTALQNNNNNERDETNETTNPKPAENEATNKSYIMMV
jgi:uncharacterized protein (UPF0332 family)